MPPTIRRAVARARTNCPACNRLVGKMVLFSQLPEDCVKRMHQELSPRLPPAPRLQKQQSHPMPKQQRERQQKSPQWKKGLNQKKHQQQSWQPLHDNDGKEKHPQPHSTTGSNQNQRQQLPPDDEDEDHYENEVHQRQVRITKKGPTANTITTPKLDAPLPIKRNSSNPLSSSSKKRYAMKYRQQRRKRKEQATMIAASIKKKALSSSLLPTKSATPSKQKRQRQQQDRRQQEDIAVPKTMMTTATIRTKHRDTPTYHHNNMKLPERGLSFDNDNYRRGKGRISSETLIHLPLASSGGWGNRLAQYKPQPKQRRQHQQSKKIQQSHQNKLPDDGVASTTKEQQSTMLVRIRWSHQWCDGGNMSMTSCNPLQSPTKVTKILVDDKNDGMLCVYKNLLNHHELQNICNDTLKQSTQAYFRCYTNRGLCEPRVHLLLHEEATDDFERPQPGYRHGNCFMKSHSFDKFPKLNALSEKMKTLFNDEKWGAGLNVVYYRNWRDRIGFHADDEQGESLVLVIVGMQCSNNHLVRRRVVLRTKQEKRVPGAKLMDGDERFEMVLNPGDAYVMNRSIQDHYEHAVLTSDLTDKELNGLDESMLGCQISFVFRRGNHFMVHKDSGEPCPNLLPRVIHKCYMGRFLPGLNDGMLYTRNEMFQNGYHRSCQCGISGSKKEGCDSIVIGQRYDDRCVQFDQLLRFLYVAELHNGALCLMKSALTHQPIRVFRSTNSHGRWKPMVDCKHTTQYRYEGLYKINLAESHSLAIRSDTEASFYFWFDRVPKGELGNEISGEEFKDSCSELCDYTPTRKMILPRFPKQNNTYGKIVVRLAHCNNNSVVQSEVLTFDVTFECEENFWCFVGKLCPKRKKILAFEISLSSCPTFDRPTHLTIRFTL